MARKKFELKFDGLEELVQSLEAMGKDVKPIAEKALEATHAHITPKIHEKMTKSNMPHQGKYWTGQSESQIIDEVNIEWSGNVGSVDVGFSLDDGLTPIWLIHGVESKGIDAVGGLKSAIYGSKTKEEIAKIQEEIFSEEVRKAMFNGK